MHPGTTSHDEIKFEIPSQSPELQYYWIMHQGAALRSTAHHSACCLCNRGLSDRSKLAHIFPLGKLAHGLHELSQSCVLVFSTKVGVLCLCFTPRCPAVMCVEVLARRGCRLSQALMQYDYHTSRQNTQRTIWKRLPWDEQWSNPVIDFTHTIFDF